MGRPAARLTAAWSPSGLWPDAQGNPSGAESGEGWGMGVGRRSPAGPLGENCLDLEQESALSTPAGATKPYHCLCLHVSVCLSLCVSVSLSLCVDVSRPQHPTGLSPGPLRQSVGHGVSCVSTSPVGTLQAGAPSSPPPPPLWTSVFSSGKWGQHSSTGVCSRGLATDVIILRSHKTGKALVPGSGGHPR